MWNFFTQKSFLNFLKGVGIILFTWFSYVGHSQDNPVLFESFYNKPNETSTRTFINKLSLGISTGYGKTFYKHNLDGFAILQSSDSIMLFDNISNIADDTLTVGYLNWINSVNSINAVPIKTTDNVVSSDSVDLGYKSVSTSIPLLFTIHYEYDRYRMGLGVEFEFHTLKKFKPLSDDLGLREFDSPVKSALFKRYFLNFGARVYRYWEYSLVVDAQVGAIKYGKNFDLSVIKKGVYFNIGATIEREFSEYFTAFIRPSYELKSYTLNFIESSNSITHKQPAIFIHIGAFLKLPELRRCKINNCQTQINHTHGEGKNWRSRMHPFYKKQNPHYGENYPKLIKYKGKNKKKINPY